MIRPVDMQLAFWKVEQQASHMRSPDSSFAQTMQGQEIVKEAREKELRVLQSDESQRENRIKEKNEHSRQDSQGYQNSEEKKDAEEQARQHEATMFKSLNELDLYG